MPRTYGDITFPVIKWGNGATSEAHGVHNSLNWLPVVNNSSYNRTSNLVLFGGHDYVNISFENFIFEINNTFTKAATAPEGNCVGFFMNTTYTRYYSTQPEMPRIYNEIFDQKCLYDRSARRKRKNYAAPAKHRRNRLRG